MKTKKSSWNIFQDLGFGKEEAANLLIRSKLMIELGKYTEQEGLT
ncbi:MAG: hypothetical protein VX667_09100 [Nitrospinota bacterium]|nr:hypothetical protein [Nitrospinota bacterium]